MPIIIPYVYPIVLRIYYGVMFLDSFGMEQDHHKDTSKYGVLESTSSMYVLQ